MGMRGPSSVAIIFGATGACVIAAVVAMWVATSRRLEVSHSSVTIDISDNPATLSATEAREAEVMASLPDAGAEILAPAEEFVSPELAPPEELFIADSIRLKLADPALREGAHADDLAALEAFYATHSRPALWLRSNGFTPEAKGVIGEIAKADDWGLDAAAFRLPQPDDQPASAEEQAAAEIILDIAILKYARYARGGRVNPPALSKLYDHKPPLRDPQVILTEIAAAETPDAYLRNLHPKHGQFVLLRQALLKARTEGLDSKEINKILINMERWRWMPADLGSLYVWLNTPEFMMYVVKGGKIIHSEKIVVGKPVYATPIFSADMKTIVFNPKWTVPPTIVREDLLPKLRRGGGGWFGGSNTAVLKKHQLKVLYKGREVDPGRVDWNNVNMSAISFTQDPGPTNVLGKVKFLYPNRHIVYMHDTIKRDLLKKQVRAEGHHCPRVDNPGQVAAVLLAEDKGWVKSKVDQLLEKGYDSAVALDDPIPVHTTYFTAVAEADGTVRNFADVYGLDGVVAKAIARKDRAPKPSVAGEMADSTP